MNGDRTETGKWVVGWVVVLAVAVSAGLLIRARRNREARIDPQTGELGQGFRYDVSALKRTDARLKIGRERVAIPSPVKNPRAIAVDEAERLYVGGENAVGVLDPLKEKAATVFPVEGAVRCLAVGLDGAVYVGYVDRVDVYSARGQPVAQWLSLGRDALLTSLAVAGTNVFVADAGQRVVWRLDSAGNVLGKIDGKAGNTAGFVIPSPYFDIAVGPGNELWVVDPGRHNVICYAFDGGRQSQWGRGGSEPEGFCGCCNPSHIAILPNGSFATSEKGLVRVKVYTAKGELTGVLAGPEAFDEEEVGLDLAADSEGRIYVLEPKRNRIRVFEVGR